MTELEQLLQDAEKMLSSLMQQSGREQKFSEESRIRFEKNLKAFEKYYPAIAKEVSGYKPDKNFRILVTSQGLGNFVPKGSNVPLYGEDCIEQVRNQVERNTNSGYYSLTRYGFESQTQDDRVHIRYMTALSNLIHKFNALKLTPLRKLPEHFPSAIFFGLGLGYHIPILLEKHSFNYIFLCEPDFEIFYASLFCTDWSEVISQVDAKNGAIFFQVGVSYQDFFKEIYRVANDIGAFSIVRSFCYQHYPSEAVNLQIKEFFSRYFELQVGFGFFNDAITGMAHLIHHVRTNQRFFIPNKKTLLNTQIPVAVVGNGPSLDNSLKFLKQHQDNLIIIAAGSALSTLHRYGVKADFHALVERTKTTYDTNIEMLPLEIFRSINLLSVDVMYPDVMNLYRWSGIGLKGPEAASVFSQIMYLRQHGKMMASMPFAGPMVSNLALSFAVMMGFKEVYLFGVDNGTVADQTHSKHSIYYDKSFKKFTTPLRSDLRHVLKGNLGGEVRSNDLLVTSKKQMESLIASSKITTFYNVGNGAALEGALALYEDDLLPPAKVQNKTAIVEKIKEELFFEDVIKFEENDLAFDLFDEICDHLTDIALTPAETTTEACLSLNRQARYLYAFRGTQFSFLFEMLKGSLLYYHCPILTTIFSFENDTETLQFYHQAMQLWSEYLQDMKVEYRRDWDKKCDYGLAKWRSLNPTAR